MTVSNLINRAAAAHNLPLETWEWCLVYLSIGLSVGVAIGYIIH